jgi:hypothetical protein
LGLLEIGGLPGVEAAGEVGDFVDAGAAEDSVLQCPASNTNSCFRTAGRFLPLSPLFLISSLRRPGLARKMRC